MTDRPPADAPPPPSPARPGEVTQVHTRLLKCSLELEESRAYWRSTAAGGPITPERAFEEYWFGARSLDRIKLLLTNLRARFDAFPAALAVLQRWSDMDLDCRRVICHWHLQLSDPLYRAFTGEHLVARRDQQKPQIRRDVVIAWVADQGPGRWTMATRIQFASKLLTAAHVAGLVTTTRDPRPLALPVVPDAALTYLLYLLREIEHTGTLFENPYLASVGLVGDALDERLRGLPDLSFHRQGAVIDLGWSFPSLTAWAAARVGGSASMSSEQRAGGHA